jgi:glycosyltransferase involved in cell wall biosynthesis
MAPESDDLLRDYLILQDEAARQRKLIEELTRPRHWTHEGPRGAQATAIHHALDRVLERAVVLRNVIRPRRSGPLFDQSPTGARGESEPDGFFTRMRQGADLLGGRVTEAPALDTFIAAANGSSRPTGQVAWLGLTAALGRYPFANELELATRAHREGGVGELAEVLRLNHLEAISSGSTAPYPLGIRTRAVIVDVTHTARHDLHTGIQRVVREVASRWLNNPRSLLVWWDDERGHLRELGYEETYRFRNWADFMPKEADSEPTMRDFENTPRSILVPWDSTFVLPELAADTDRSSAYCGLVESGLIERFGAIGFDLVPLTAAETVHKGMVSAFPRHVSVIKHADRLSAISESAANEFRSLCNALAAQGLTGPAIEAHQLPPTPFDVSDTAVATVRSVLRRSVLGDDELPVVLVVGSREPRKNQIAVLEAAHQLWIAGHRFHLVMVGGSGWNSTDIDDEIDKLRTLGVDVVLRTRATEDELFAWYRIARFSVFPSLYEGFGLPIAESLRIGTPVITSNYGSMREIASLGGALVVDPRDPAQVRDAMARLLTDEELNAKLRIEANQRHWPTWDGYATDVWNHLVESGSPARTGAD